MAHLSGWGELDWFPTTRPVSFHTLTQLMLEQKWFLHLVGDLPVLQRPNGTYSIHLCLQLEYCPPYNGRPEYFGLEADGTLESWTVTGKGVTEEIVPLPEQDITFPQPLLTAFRQWAKQQQLNLVIGWEGQPIISLW